MRGHSSTAAQPVGTDGSEHAGVTGRARRCSQVAVGVCVCVSVWACVRVAGAERRGPDLVPERAEVMGIGHGQRADSVLPRLRDQCWHPDFQRIPGSAAVGIGAGAKAEKLQRSCDSQASRGRSLG